MIVRELVTLLRYDADTSGVNKFEGALNGLLAKLAAVLAAHDVMELADQWNTIAGRVMNVTDSVTETTRVMDVLQKQAEATGASFEGVGSLFAQLKTTGSSLNLSTDQILQLTESISKLGTLGGGTAAGARRGMIQIEEMFSLGTVQMQHLKALMIDIPGAVDVIAKSMDGGKKAFMEMVHAGTMTSEKFAALFLKAQDEINQRFQNMPMTFARAFETVHSLFGRLVYDIGKATGAWEWMARAIVWAARETVDGVREMADVVGGYGNLLRLAGIFFVALFGPAAVAMLVRMASMVGLLLTPWAGVVAAIVAVGLAIDDVLAWMRGAASVTEDLIGPFAEWKDKIDGWKATIGDAVDYGIGKAREFAAYVTEAFSGHEAEIEGIKDAWAALWNGQDPLGDLKEAVRSVTEMFHLMGEGIDLLFPSLSNLGTGWTLGGEVKATLRDIRTMIDSIREASDWLNGLQDKILNFSPMNGIRTLANKFRTMTGQEAIWDENVGKIAPSTMVPTAGNTNNSNVTATVTNNITTTSDTPAAVAAAAADGTRSGLRQSVGRDLELATPGVEFGRRD
ncbi:MAG: putative bacteriophage-related transrane protein [Rhodoferax sp.]|nr:putative bacteriophage-related transrane protein [Rhodoferax sp.]